MVRFAPQNLLLICSWTIFLRQGEFVDTHRLVRAWRCICYEASMGAVGETGGYLRRGRGQNRAGVDIWRFGVKRTGVARCGPIGSDSSRPMGAGLLGYTPLLWESCPSLSLPAFHSTPSSTFSDIPLPVLLLVFLRLRSALILHPVRVRLADVVLLLAGQEVVDVAVALPLLLPPPLLFLATLAPRPRPLRAEGFGGGGGGTAVVH